MKKYLAIASAALAGTAMMIAAAPAMARVDVDLNIGVPGVYQAPAPVYVQPRPVYVQPQPVYVQPQPYVQYRPAYVMPEREREWRERQIRAREWREREARQHYGHDNGNHYGHDNHDRGEHRGRD
ncbi:MAG: virulence protein [Herminiimonas sp.]|nr:virulence protein [Herminiimonas sp.]